MSIERGNQTLPAAKVYFNPLDDDGNYEGYRFLGNVPEFPVTIETEFAEHQKATSAIREMDKRVAISVTRSGSPTLDDMTPENFELFLNGELEEFEQEAATGDSVTITVQPGRYYTLAESDANPFGARDLSSITVEDDGDATSYTEGDDWTINTETGLLFVTRDGDIEADTDIVVTYDAAETSWYVISSSDQRAREGQLLLIANNSDGEDIDHYMPETTLTPGGDLQLINDGTEWQQMPFELSILTPDGGGAAIQVGTRPGVT